MGALLALALAAAPAVEVDVAHRRVTAPDGVALALYRYALAGARVEPAARPAVLLLPELGFGRAVFDVHGGGLARWLAARGFVVYVGEARGQGKAGPAGSLAAVATKDVPALLAAAAKEHGGRVDLVAHGWAGTLALAAAAGEAKALVRRVVALNTPAEAEVPSALAGRFLEGGGRLTALSLSPAGARDFALLFSMDAPIRAETLRAVRAVGVRDLGDATAKELLGWMRAGELALGEGDGVKARLAAYDAPTLQLLGLADGFAPPELCGPLREVSKARVQVHTFSRVEDAEDYTHLSLLLGDGATRDIFPRIERFLSAEDAP